MTQNNKYVLIYAYNCDNPEKFIIIKKDRPQWQCGRYNLPGGHIENGESPEEAAIRELKEETGLFPLINAKPKILGTIYGQFGVVYCIKIPVVYNRLIPRDTETEIPKWTTYHRIKNNKLLIPNLKIIIPLMHQELIDWIIKDTSDSNNKDMHSFNIIVKINES